jgi:hypothetical protein
MGQAHGSPLPPAFRTASWPLYSRGILPSFAVRARTSSAGSLRRPLIGIAATTTPSTRKVKKLKRLIGRSVVDGQHSGAGGVSVRHGQSRVCDFRPDGWQYSATERSVTRPGAQAHDPVVGLHSRYPGQAKSGSSAPKKTDLRADNP